MKKPKNVNMTKCHSIPVIELELQWNTSKSVGTHSPLPFRIRKWIIVAYNGKHQTRERHRLFPQQVLKKMTFRTDYLTSALGGGITGLSPAVYEDISKSKENDANDKLKDYRTRDHAKYFLLLFELQIKNLTSILGHSFGIPSFFLSLPPLTSKIPKGCRLVSLFVGALIWRLET